MAVVETLFNKGYVAGAVETAYGVPATPTDYFQAYDANLKTKRNFNKLAPAAGNLFGTQTVTQGLRDHTGDMTLVFEPNTAEKLFNMILSVAAKTGTGPYTSVATLGTPKSYTIDIYDGSATVQRYFGCQIEKLTTEVKENEIRIKPTISALGSFQGREVASYTSGSPNVITLKTDYDPSPTTGLVVGDTIQYIQANGTITNLTISALSSTTVSCTPNSTTISGAAAGDMIALRPQTPSFTMLAPALWTNAVFGFGSTAATALTNATIANQTRVEPGSTWEISFPFKDAKGEHRSGAQDPAALLRKPADISLTIKKYWLGTTDVETYNNMAKNACVIRYFAYSGANTYEVRVTFHNITTDDPAPQYKAGEINYSEIKYISKYDTSDGAAFDVTIVNNNATLT